MARPEQDGTRERERRDVQEREVTSEQPRIEVALKANNKSPTSYLLFSIEWDDNWNVWERNPLMAVESDDETTTVVKAVLKEFARERLDESGNGAWNEFLKSIIDDRLELLTGE